MTIFLIILGTHFLIGFLCGIIAFGIDLRLRGSMTITVTSIGHLLSWIAVGFIGFFILLYEIKDKPLFTVGKKK